MSMKGYFCGYLGQSSNAIAQKTGVVIGTLLFLIIIGSSLRFINLGNPSFWVDELNHLYAAKSIMGGRGPLLPSGWPYSLGLPYTYLVALSMKIFGEGEFGCRFPSAVFGVLAIPLVFWIGYRLFNNIKIGLISALFITFFPFEIGWSRVCRMYTLFQFLFLLGFYIFYRAFERDGSEKPNEEAISQGRKIWVSIKKWEINWALLLLSCLILMLSFYVDHLTALFLPSLICYWGIMTGLVIFRRGWSEGFKSKYFWFLAVSIIVTATVLAVFPTLRAKLIELINFYPVWAQQIGAKGKLTYVLFLASNLRFPVGAFFLIGALQVIIRFNRAGFYTLINFAVPFLLHSFLFKTKVDRYIFNLFPLFLIIASYGFSNLIELELQVAKRTFRKFKRWVSEGVINALVIIVMFSWLPFSRWFYNSFEIPTIRSGPCRLGGLYTNGAVTHEDWREACNYVKKFLQPDDLVITTQTLNVLYYLGRVDFCIYSGDLGVFHEIWKAGDYNLEPYANIPVIEDINSLKKIITENKRGWIIADFLRFEKQIPKDIVAFVKEKLTKHFSQADETIFIYSWNSDSFTKLKEGSGY